MTSGGFAGLTAKYDFAGAIGERGIDTEVLQIGDHDQSGVHVFKSTAEDVAQIMYDLGNDDIEITFTRLAVTKEQIKELRLPAAPPKATDNRSFDDTVTVQAEAIAPDDLARIVRDAITSRMDLRIMGEWIAWQEREQEKLEAYAKYVMAGLSRWEKRFGD
jgi:hypothetical protein